MVNLKLLYDEETIQKRIQEMAEEIDRDYEGKSILAICMLLNYLNKFKNSPRWN